ncbi:hypothetical protein, partial [Bacteroides acidifaciens]|uniref:hypothetical protein n=1 Tax=Bacteroides acidifaciens TaxID=85831 RepID=UPI003013DC12
MVATVEVRIFFLTLLSLSYEKFVVTLRMATLSKILVLCVGLALSCNLWAQSREFGCRNVDGVWQEKTDIVNSAFLARYTINADSIWYSVNEYDGLNPIRSFGGTYTINRDSISIRIQYIKRVSYTAICRDQFLPASNQWSILDEGSLTTDTLPAPQIFVLPIKMEGKTLVIDDVPFYLREFGIRNTIKKLNRQLE